MCLLLRLIFTAVLDELCHLRPYKNNVNRDVLPAAVITVTPRSREAYLCPR
jgi:hypothetical protein